MENKTPLGDLLADARQKLEGIAEPEAEPLELVGNDEPLKLILNEKQGEFYQSICNLALNSPNLLPIVAAELLHQRKHPGSPLSATEGQLNRRVDAVRALQAKPEDLQALEALTKGLVSCIFAMLSQMTYQQPVIHIAHDLPAHPEARHELQNDVDHQARDLRVRYPCR